MSEDLQKKLELLRAARIEREEKAALEAEQERLRRDVADEEALAAAEAKHGPLGKNIIALKTDLGVVILRRPHHLEMRKMLAKEKLDEREATVFVRSCVVHPDGASFETLLEERPAIGGQLVELVLRLARGRTEELAGKS